MTNENSLKEFEDMFDLSPSSKDDEDTQAEEYGHSMDSEEPFNKLVKEVSNEIKEVSDKGDVLKVEDPHDIIKDVTSKSHDDFEEQIPANSNEVVEEEAEKVVAVAEAEVEEDFDTLPEQIISEKEVVKEVAEVHEEMQDESHTPNAETLKAMKEADEGNCKSFDTVEDLIEDLNKDEEEKIPLDADGGVSGFINHVKPEDIPKISEIFEEQSSLDNFSVSEDPMTENDKIKWSLISPSTMYETFYHQKKRVLDSCIVGGQVEFSRWNHELEDAQVDVVTEVFDQQIIIKQMEDVQQFRNRVKYIGVRVNNQYFLFDRFTPLLRGYLARIQYLKPALKQDGLILEHMGDVEMYFERLRGLHKSVADTEKNLAAAYEMLSRKVTICMELPPVERYDKPEQKANGFQYRKSEEKCEEKSSEEMEGFDDLPGGAQSGPQEKKSGAVGWKDL